MITMVVASAENGVIGKGNDIPWKMRSDMRHFKSLTTSGADNHLVMGRKTFESMGSKVLPGRTMHVVTRSTDQIAEDNEFIYTHKSVEEALTFLEQVNHISEKGISVWVIGGASIYKYCLEQDLVKKVIQTVIHATVEGDTYFEMPDGWKETFASVNMPSDGDDYSYTIKELTKL